MVFVSFVIASKNNHSIFKAPKKTGGNPFSSKIGKNFLFPKKNPFQIAWECISDHLTGFIPTSDSIKKPTKFDANLYLEPHDGTEQVINLESKMRFSFLKFLVLYDQRYDNRPLFCIDLLDGRGLFGRNTAVDRSICSDKACAIARYLSLAGKYHNNTKEEKKENTLEDKCNNQIVVASCMKILYGHLGAGFNWGNPGIVTYIDYSDILFLKLFIPTGDSSGDSSSYHKRILFNSLLFFDYKRIRFFSEHGSHMGTVVLWERFDPTRGKKSLEMLNLFDSLEVFCYFKDHFRTGIIMTFILGLVIIKISLGYDFYKDAKDKIFFGLSLSFVKKGSKKKLLLQNKSLTKQMGNHIKQRYNRYLNS
jgi:hypothetical protein